MNKRIEAIATKAKMRIDKFKCVTGTNSIDLLDVELEKFAELIIAECANIALKSGGVAKKSEQAKVEADRIYHKIQEHFGID